MARISVQFSANSNFNALRGQIAQLNAQLASSATAISKANATNAAGMADIVGSFRNAINASGQYTATTMRVKDSTSQLINQIQRQRVSMGQLAQMYTGQSTALRELTNQQMRLKNAFAATWSRDALGNIQGDMIMPMNDYSKAVKGTAEQTEFARMQSGLLGTALQAAGQDAIRSGKQMQWAGRQLSFGFTQPLMLLGGAAAYAAFQVDKEMTRLTKVYGDLGGATEEELKAVEEATRATADRIAKTMGIAVKETVALGADLAAAGFQGPDLQGMIEQTTRLRVLGETTAEDAMKTITTLNTAFGIKAPELLAQAVDQMNAVESQTVATIEDLAIAIPKVGGVMANLGGTVAELNTLMVALRAAGFSASDGANALRSGLGAIAAPSGAAAKTLATLGINIDEIVKKTGGNLIETFKELSLAMQDLNPVEQQKALTTLFGKYQFGKLGSVIKQLGNDVTDATTQVGRAQAVAEASSVALAAQSQRELDRLTASPSKRIEKAYQGIVSELEKIGKQILPYIATAIELVLKLIEAFGKLPNVVKFMALIPLAVLALVAPLTIIMGLFRSLAGHIAFAAGAFLKFRSGVKGIETEQQAMSRIMSQSNGIMQQQTANVASLGRQLKLTTADILRFAEAERRRAQASAAAAAAAATTRTSPLLAPNGRPFVVPITPPAAARAGGGIPAGTLNAALQQRVNLQNQVNAGVITEEQRRTRLASLESSLNATQRAHLTTLAGERARLNAAVQRGLLTEREMRQSLLTQEQALLAAERKRAAVSAAPERGSRFGGVGNALTGVAVVASGLTAASSEIGGLINGISTLILLTSALGLGFDRAAFSSAKMTVAASTLPGILGKAATGMQRLAVGLAAGTGPLGAVVAGVAAVGLGLFAVKKNIDENKKAMDNWAASSKTTADIMGEIFTQFDDRNISALERQAQVVASATAKYNKMVERFRQENTESTRIIGQGTEDQARTEAIRIGVDIYQATRSAEKAREAMRLALTAGNREGLLVGINIDFKNPEEQVRNARRQLTDALNAERSTSEKVMNFFSPEPFANIADISEEGRRRAKELGQGIANAFASGNIDTLRERMGSIRTAIEQEATEIANRFRKGLTDMDKGVANRTLGLDPNSPRLLEDILLNWDRLNDAQRSEFSPEIQRAAIHSAKLRDAQSQIIGVLKEGKQVTEDSSGAVQTLGQAAPIVEKNLLGVSGSAQAVKTNLEAATEATEQNTDAMKEAEQTAKELGSSFRGNVSEAIGDQVEEAMRQFDKQTESQEGALDRRQEKEVEALEAREEATNEAFDREEKNADKHYQVIEKRMEGRFEKEDQAIQDAQELAERGLEERQRAEEAAAEKSQSGILKAMEVGFERQTKVREEAFEEQQEAREEQFEKESESAEKNFKRQEDARDRQFEAETQAAEKAFERQADARQAQFDKEVKAAENAYEQQTEAREEQFEAETKAAEKAFERQTEARQAQFEKEAKAAEDIFEQQTEAREAQFNKETKAAEKAFEAQTKARESQFEKEAKAAENAYELQTEAREEQFEQETKAAEKAYEAQTEAREDQFEKEAKAAEKLFKRQEDARKQQFDNETKAAEKAFKRQQDAREEQFDNETKAAEKAFRSQQEAREQHFKKENKAAEKAFKRQQDAREEQFENETEAAEAAFRKQEKARSKAQKREIDNLEDRFDKANKAAEDRHEAAIQRIEDEGEAERKRDEERQRAFEKEKTRLQRLAEIANANIDFNIAVDTGNFDEAAKIQNNLGVQQQSWAMDDASEEDDLRREANDAQRQTRIQQLRLEFEAEQELMRQAQEAAMERLRELHEQQNEAARAAYERQSELAREAYERQNEKAREAYENENELRRAAYERQNELAREAYEAQNELARKAFELQNERAREAFDVQVELSRQAFERQSEKAREAYDLQVELARASFERQNEKAQEAYEIQSELARKAFEDQNKKAQEAYEIQVELARAAFERQNEEAREAYEVQSELARTAFERQNERAREAYDAQVELSRAAFERQNEKAREAYDVQVELARDAFERQNEKAQEAYEAQSELARAAFERQNERAREAYDAQNEIAKRAFERQKEIAQEAFEAQRKSAQEGFEDLNERARDTYDTTSEKARLTYEAQVEQARASFERQNERMKEYHDEQKRRISDTYEHEKRKLDDRQERQKEALENEKEINRERLKNRRDAASDGYDADKESIDARFEKLKTRLKDERGELRYNLDKQLQYLQESVPKSEAEYKRLNDDIRRLYKETTGTALTETSRWKDTYLDGFERAFSSTMAEVRDKRKWEQVGKDIGDATTEGMLGMSFKQFSQWMSTGKMPERELLDRRSNPGLFREFHHGGGSPGTDGGRAGRPRTAPLYPDEVPTILQRGEYVIDKDTVSKYGVSTFQRMQEGAFYHGGGHVGMEGVAGIAYRTLGNALEDALAAGAQRQINALAAAGRMDQIPGRVFERLDAAGGGNLGGGNFTLGGPGKYGDVFLDAAQLENARIIMSVGKSMGASNRDLIISLMTAFQESNLKNINYGDRDSVGLFQQRTSQGWGTVQQIMNPQYSSRKFFERLLAIRTRDEMPLTLAAQAVQRSAFPYAYAKWENEARAIIAGRRTSAAPPAQENGLPVLQVPGYGGGFTSGGGGNASFDMVRGKLMGVNLELLRRLNAVGKDVKDAVNVNSGYRSSAEQRVLYERYLSGNGPLAAKPGASWHEFRGAVDARFASGATMRSRESALRANGLWTSVPSEHWHVQRRDMSDKQQSLREPYYTGAAAAGGGGGAIIPRSGAYGGVQPFVAGVADHVKAKFGPFPGGIGGYVNRNIAGTAQKSDHAYGKALDFMSNNNTALGQRVADYLVANAGKFKTDNLIWNRRIWSAGGSGWRRYYGANPHTDHPHYDTFDRGGEAQGIGVLAKNTIRPERVLSPQQTESFNRLVNMLEALVRGGLINAGTPAIQNLRTAVRFDDAKINAHKNQAVLAAPLAAKIERGIGNLDRSSNVEYNINVNVPNSNANPEAIARVVENRMRQREHRIGIERKIGERRTLRNG